jgi:hypothetical protein
MQHSSKVSIVGSTPTQGTISRKFMYWIEVDFANGKTLRKETEDLNESYSVYARYCCGSPHKRHPVQRVRAGYEDAQTFECDHLNKIDF